MKKKHVIAIFAMIVGVSSASAVDFWPHYAIVIQMALYTSMVFVPLFLGLWAERNRHAFRVSMFSAIIVHGLFLYMIRSTFPFRTVLVIVPIALVEAAGKFAALDKILCNRSVVSPK